MRDAATSLVASDVGREGGPDPRAIGDAAARFATAYVSQQFEVQTSQLGAEAKLTITAAVRARGAQKALAFAVAAGARRARDLASLRRPQARTLQAARSRARPRGGPTSPTLPVFSSSKPTPTAWMNMFAAETDKAIVEIAARQRAERLEAAAARQAAVRTAVHGSDSADRTRAARLAHETELARRRAEARKATAALRAAERRDLLAARVAEGNGSEEETEEVEEPGGKEKGPRISPDLRIYDIQRDKSTKIAAFAKRYFSSWSLDRQGCVVAGNGPLSCLRDARWAEQPTDRQTEIGRQVGRHRSLALFWPMGWGKTHGGVLAAECALAQALASRRTHTRRLGGSLPRSAGLRRRIRLPSPGRISATEKEEEEEEQTSQADETPAPAHTAMVVVLTKAGLVDNFRQDLLAYGRSEEWIDQHYVFVGHERGLEEGTHAEAAVAAARGAILIVDEVHELRTEIVFGGSGTILAGKGAAVAARMAAAADRVVLLTGTPLINGPGDLYNIALFMADERERAAFRAAFPSAAFLATFAARVAAHDPQSVGRPLPSELAAQERVLNAVFACRVSYIDPALPLPDFPETRETNVLIEMNPQYLAAYERKELEVATGEQITTKNYLQVLRAAANEGTNSNSFLIRLRQAVNQIEGVPSPKIAFVLAKAREAQRLGLTMIVYSSFLDQFGLGAIKRALDDEGIVALEITGRTPIGRARPRKGRKGGAGTTRARGTRARTLRRGAEQEEQDENEETDEEDDEEDESEEEEDESEEDEDEDRVPSSKTEKKRPACRTRVCLADEFSQRRATVILISKAGGTGISLFGASYHINLEPMWNDALKAQATFRGVRRRSHVRRPGIVYPRAFRPLVEIYNLFLAKPTDMAAYQAKMGADAAARAPGAPDKVLAIWANARKVAASPTTRRRRSPTAAPRPLRVYKHQGTRRTRLPTTSRR